MSERSALTWETIRPAVPPGARPEPARLLRDAMETAPELVPFLRTAAASDKPVLLLVNDPQRSTQTRPTLVALAEFTRGWPQTPRFRVLVATGAHRFSSNERRLFETSTFVKTGLRLSGVAWHSSEASESLTEFAGARRNRWIAEHNHLLAIGSVEPHYFAGVTGAHKTVTIGCLSHADIERNHAGALEPASDVLRLQGNPVFDGAVALLHGLQRAGKHVCAVNQVVGGRELLAAAVGEPLETLDALLPTVRRLYAHTAEGPADVLHLRVPPPLGRSLYQADKALKNNHWAVRDGGGIVLEADCPEGIGPSVFMDVLRRAPDYAAAVRIVREEGYRLGDHKAVKLRHLTDPDCRGVHVALVSPNVSPADARVAGMRVFSQVEPAISWLAGVVQAPRRRGLVVEDAGFVTVAPA